MELLTSTLFSTLIVVLTGILIYLGIKRKDVNHWTSTVPKITSVFPFGHILHLVRNRPMKGGPLGAGALHAFYAMAKVFEEHGMFLLKLGFNNTVILCSAENAEVLLKSQTELAKSTFYTPLKSVLGDGLITSCGDETWKLHRKTINPMFHTRMLERFQQIMSEHAAILVNKMQQQEGSQIEMGLLYGPCTFDIVMEGATGENMEVQISSENQVLTSIERFMEIAAMRVYHPWLLPNIIFCNSTLGKESKMHSDIAIKYFRKVLYERRGYFLEKGSIETFEETEEKPCLLDLLLLQQANNVATFSDNEIIHELENIAIPGFETTTAALSYATFLIGHHPEVQKNIHKEMDEIFGNDCERVITTQDFQNMKYLECVIKESLRLFPPVPIVARVLKENLPIGKTIIPKGTDVVVFSPIIHKSAKYYDNPEAFNPERFFPENLKDRPACAYIPFSAGPRNCIGGSFATRAMRNILASVLRRFEIQSVDPVDTLHINFATIGKPHKPVMIRIKSRHQA